MTFKHTETDDYKPTEIIINNYEFGRLKHTGAMCGVNNKAGKMYFTVEDGMFCHL
jgi:hypothetical protein